MTDQSYPGLRIDGDDALDAMVKFLRGDPAELAKWLRGDKPIDKCLRTFLAGIIDGTIVPKKRARGIKSRISPKQATQLREWDSLLKSNGYKSGKIVQFMAEGFNVSEATIRDMLAKRKTFAEK